jgi:hypothetical protein
MAIAAPQPQAGPRACYGTCPSQTTLSMATQTVIFGSEQAQVFSATVGSGIAGAGAMPGGIVAIRVGPVTLCTITLSRGTGACRPTPHALPPRHKPYPIKADYTGDQTFHRSSSPKQPLKVVRR